MSKAAISTPKYFGSSGTVRSSNVVRDRIKELTDAIAEGRRVGEKRAEQLEEEVGGSDAEAPRPLRPSRATR